MDMIVIYCHLSSLSQKAIQSRLHYFSVAYAKASMTACGQAFNHPLINTFNITFTPL